MQTTKLIYRGILRYTMSATTIKIRPETKHELDRLREYKSESYDDVIKKVVCIARKSEKEPELSQELLESIRKARERIRHAGFIKDEDAKRRLGL